MSVSTDGPMSGNSQDQAPRIARKGAKLFNQGEATPVRLEELLASFTPLSEPWPDVDAGLLSDFDPLATFTEWDSEADRRAYGKL